jgi:hypothetical protein
MEVAALYARACREQEARQLGEARQSFLRVRELAGGYRDADTRLAEVERRLAVARERERERVEAEERASAVESRPAAPVVEVPPRPEPRAEREPKRRSPLVPGLVGAAAVIVVLAIIGIAIPDTPAVDPAPDPTPVYPAPVDPAGGGAAPQPATGGGAAPVDPKLQAGGGGSAPDPAYDAKVALQEAIARAMSLKYASFRTLDAGSLTAAFGGSALAQLQGNLLLLGNSGHHMEVRWETPLLQDYWFSADGTQATAAITQRLSGEVHQNGTDFCVGRLDPYVQSARLALRRSSGRWVIVNEEEEDAPDPVPCGGAAY